MELSKKMFIKDGLTGCIFIICGIILQFSDKLSDVVFYGLSFISAVLIITITLIKLITWKTKSEPVDELAKLSMLKAEAVLYKIIINLALFVAFFTHLILKNEYVIVLNWNTFFIFYGCCYLAYYFLFKHFEKTGEMLSD